MEYMGCRKIQPEMFGIMVRFDLREGHEAAFDRLVSETLGRIEAEELGTFAYVVHTVEGALSSRIFYELYEDRAAFRAHEQSRHVQRFLEERQQHLSQDPQVSFLSTQMGLVRKRAVAGD
jgi:quinol monooxygenase YgiN